MTDDEGKCAAQTVKGVHTIDPHHPDMEYKCRQQYHAMVMIMDEVVGNITDAYKAKGMWEKTLVVMSSDNGGPVDLAENAANNWPKRGGKYSLFEGGISVAAFVSGGYLPAAVKGTTNNGIVHIADWYATFLHLAGIADPTDKRAAAAIPAVPPIDSINQWMHLSGATKVSPRAATPLPIGKNCIVQGDWKLITTGTSPDFWQGVHFPNTSSATGMAAYRESSPADLAAYRESLRYGEELPPRPYPMLKPCDAELASQNWQYAGSTNKGGTVCLGLGRICALYYRASTLYQIHYHIR
jgi:arylsulfatase A-like enzyme